MVDGNGVLARPTIRLGLALALVAFTGCQESAQSPADDFASCLQKNGVDHGAPGYGGGTLLAEGRSIDLEHAEVSLLPKRGPGPPDKVALFDSDEAAQTWTDLTIRNVRDKGHSKRVIRFPEDRAVLVTNNGVSPHRAVVKKCLDGL